MFIPEWIALPSILFDNNMKKIKKYLLICGKIVLMFFVRTIFYYRRLIVNSEFIIDLEFNKTINYAMWQNYVPFIRSIVLKNNGEQPLNNVKLKISFEPEIAGVYEHSVELINPNTPVSISPVSIALSPNYLAGLNERTSANMHIDAFLGEESIFHKTEQIDILSYDQWMGTSIMPEILCSFVTPNYQGLSAILSMAGNYLAKWNGSSDFTGYLTNNPNNVKLQMAAIYAALKEWGISYSLHAANFEEVGQKIRMADIVLEQRRGNCLDFSVTYASCLEAVGLNPIIIITEGHAFVGCWLENMTFPECVEYDVSAITKRIAQGINEIEVVECTLFRAGTDSVFDDAVSSAAHKLLKPDEFVMAIDVKRSRTSKVLPLAQRTLKEGIYVIEAPADTTYSSAAPTTNICQTVILADENVAKLTKEQLWERKLLDLGLRNPLINFRPNRSSVQLMAVDLPKLEDEIAKGIDFKIMPVPQDFDASQKDSKIYDTENNSDYINDVALDEFKSNRIRTFISEKDLTKAMKHLQRQAKLSLEENGSNTLYLALGFLRWYESDISEKARYAPLVLIPVDITKKLVSNTYSIKIRDDEAQMNITLLELLKQDFGISLSGLDPLPEDESGIDIMLVFNTMRKAVMAKSRWDVEELAFVGIFSFSQFIMWNDIRNRKEDIAKNKVVKSLISGKMEWEPQFDKIAEENFDANVKPSDVAIPTSVDSSQMAAICAAAKGESFVLFGPPGTGKSQTITNMIANALYQGKSVLFVAEKMAALTVVQKRLEKIGLGPFCLELHSNKAQKRVVLGQLAKTLEVGRIKEPESYQQTADKLYEVRQQLNDIMLAIHSPVKCDKSLYMMISEYEDNIENKDKVLFDIDFVKGLTAESYNKLIDDTKHLITTYNSCNEVTDIFKAVQLKDYTMTLRDEISKVSVDFAGTVTALINEALSVQNKLSITDNQTGKILGEIIHLCKLSDDYEALLDDIINDVSYESKKEEINKLIDKGVDYTHIRKEIDDEFNAGIYSTNPFEFKAKWLQANEKWFLGKIFATKEVIKLISAYAKNPAKITKNNVEKYIELLIQSKNLEQEINASSQTIGDVLGSAYKGINTDFIKYNNILKGTDEAWSAASYLRSVIDGFVFKWDVFRGNKGLIGAYDNFINEKNRLKASYMLDFDVYSSNTQMLQSILSDITKWKDNIDELREYIGYYNAKCNLIASGGSPICDALINKDVAPQNLVSAVLCSINYNLAVTTIEENEILRSFTGTNILESIEKFKEVTSEFEKLTINELVAKLSAGIPSSSIAAVASSELGILQKAIKSNGRNMSIRKLFDSIPDILRKMCPCMLMSPISVAQYIDPSFAKFDLVIFDEASQLPTSEAVGAIARGENVIVVGDPNQLPPTSFFSSSKVDDENMEVEDLDSVLDDCLAISMPSRHLLWHYRSRHESLIAYSNAKYYDNKLHTFPSPNDMDCQVKWVNVDGYYDKGASRCNRFEAEAIVEEIIERLSDPAQSHNSIGVVTFSVVQQHLIEDLLEEKLSSNPELAALAYESEEPVFIKNLENVQGDERDIILFSIGYGPDKDGKVSMNFGPLNNEGGWRRLNVAISRSRKEMVVFSCIKPEQIDLSRTRSEGVVGLKGFLEFAKNGKNSLIYREDTNETKKDAVVEAIAFELRKEGYKVNTSIGSSKFKVDIGIVDPEDENNYILGIMCDGSNYVMSKTSRDRNILQPSVLKGLGWDIMNVWVIDWFDSNKKVKETIKARINKALEEKKNPVPKEEIIETKPCPPTDILESYERVEAEIPKDDNRIEYVEFKPKRHYLSEEFYNQVEGKNSQALVDALDKIIETEAPVSTDTIKSRLAQMYTFTKRTAKFESAADGFILSQKQYPFTINDDMRFIWKVGQVPNELKTYRVSEYQVIRTVKEICIQERLAGIVGVLKIQLGISRDDLARESAKLFGYTRLTPNISNAFTDAIDYGISTGRLVEKDGRINLCE